MHDSASYPTTPHTRAQRATFRAALATLTIALGTGGCLGSDGKGGDGECADVAACGGDVVGEWRIDSLCIGDLTSPSGLPATCGDLIRDIQVQPDATYTFTDDTIVVDGELLLDVRYVYTAACLEGIAGQDVRVDASLCNSIEDSFNNDSDVDSGECQLAGSTCDCTAQMHTTASADAMGYHLEGNTLVDDSDGSRMDYCVQGDTLHIDGSDADDIGGRTVLHRL